MDHWARKRAKHLQRARYHTAFGNAAAAKAHLGRAEQLLFGNEFETVARDMIVAARDADAASQMHRVEIHRAVQVLAAELRRAFGWPPQFWLQGLDNFFVEAPGAENGRIVRLSEFNTGIIIEFPMQYTDVPLEREAEGRRRVGVPEPWARKRAELEVPSDQMET